MHARASSAPSADDLLGRLPIARLISKVEATVAGWLSDPLRPAAGRDRMLAKSDRGLDVDVDGGFRLRALDAIDGAFHLHLTPPFGSKGSSLHVALPDEGGESSAIVRTHPHAPDAPLGFYNLGAARGALEEIDRILCAAIASRSTSRVDRLRAEQIALRVERALAHVEKLSDSLLDHPELGELVRAAKLAYEVKKPGDAIDVAYQDAVKVIRTLALDAPTQAQVDRDLATIAADREKWIVWRASTGLHTFYL